MSEVVVVGGGIAALETVLALRALAGDGADVTLVAPEDEFVLRPLLAAEPFGVATAPRLLLGEFAADCGARHVAGRVRSVDGAGHRVVLSGGDTLAYDVLVLAPGARNTPAFDGVITLGDGDLDGLLDATVRRVACIALTTAGWPLPLYETALLTARRGIEVTLVTPERRPLEMFGAVSSARVAALLEAAGVRFLGAQQSNVAGGVLQLPGRGALQVDRIVSLPLVRGPHIGGVPGDPLYGFIPVDGRGRVIGMRDVYAAGDATTEPVKQGALAAQQALAIAEQIAGLPPSRTDPGPRGLLLTGDGDPVALGPDLRGWDPTKLPGRHLGPYLLAHTEGVRT